MQYKMHIKSKMAILSNRLQMYKENAVLIHLLKHAHG